MNIKAIEQILPLALKQGLLKPEDEFNPCLVDYLNQANRLLKIVQTSGFHGLTTSQVVEKSQLSLNTCKCYLRVLVKLGIILVDKNGPCEAVWKWSDPKKFFEAMKDSSSIKENWRGL